MLANYSLRFTRGSLRGLTRAIKALLEELAAQTVC
jgi:hypothetical protein